MLVAAGPRSIMIEAQSRVSVKLHPFTVFKPALIHQGAPKIFPKIFKKGIDNPPKMCYNKYVIKRERNERECLFGRLLIAVG